MATKNSGWVLLDHHNKRTTLHIRSTSTPSTNSFLTFLADLSARGPSAKCDFKLTAEWPELLIRMPPSSPGESSRQHGGEPPPHRLISQLEIFQTHNVLRRIGPTHLLHRCHALRASPDRRQPAQLLPRRHLRRARPRDPAELVPLRGATGLPRLFLEAHHREDDALLRGPLLADDNDGFGGQ